MSTSETVQAIVLAVVVLTGVGGFGWFRILKTTNDLLKEQNEELKKQNESLKVENKEWYEKHLENQKDIAKLQGQIDTLTKIPLHKIDESLAVLAKTSESSADSNKKIFKILSKSALIAAEDREVLTSQHVETQQVEHQTVNAKE